MVRSPSGVTRIRQRAVGRAVGRRRGVERDADGADVVAEDLAELVVGDLADEGGACRRSEARPAMVLAAEPPEHLDRRAHGGVQRVARVGVDRGA